MPPTADPGFWGLPAGRLPLDQSQAPYLYLSLPTSFPGVVFLAILDKVIGPW